LGTPVSGNLHPFVVLESYGKMDMKTQLKPMGFLMFFAPQLEQLESMVESILETAMQLGETVGLGSVGRGEEC